MMNDENSPAAHVERVLEEAEALIWALLDDRLEAADSTRLCQLIENNDAVRARYIDCVQLHLDLQKHFAVNGEAPKSKQGGSPVLSNLTFGNLPGAGSLPSLHD
jgi:anti-sigma factor RsiW